MAMDGSAGISSSTILAIRTSGCGGMNRATGRRGVRSITTGKWLTFILLEILM
jgi:hypothetical protein